MNEPVSLLDFGLYQVENEMKANCQTTKEAYFLGKKNLRINNLIMTCYTNYIWKLNRINLSILLVDFDKQLSNEQLRQLSKEFIKGIRTHFGIIEGELVKIGEGEGAKSIISSYFSHRGYRTNIITKDNYNEIDNIARIIIRTHSGIIAETPLVGTEKDISYRSK